MESGQTEAEEASKRHEALTQLVAVYSSNPYAPRVSQPLAVCRSWLAFAHPLHLKLFYYCTATKRSQWEPPAVWDHELSVMPPLR